jgi:hypothetical protein
VFRIRLQNFNSIIISVKVLSGTIRTFRNGPETGKFVKPSVYRFWSEDSSETNNQFKATPDEKTTIYQYKKQ